MNTFDSLYVKILSENCTPRSRSLNIDDIALLCEKGLWKRLGQLGAIGAAGLASALGPNAHGGEYSDYVDQQGNQQMDYINQSTKSDLDTLEKIRRTFKGIADRPLRLGKTGTGENPFADLEVEQKLFDEWAHFVGRLIDNYTKTQQDYHKGKTRKGLSLLDIADNYKEAAKDLYRQIVKKDINDDKQALELLDGIFSGKSQKIK